MYCLAHAQGFPNCLTDKYLKYQDQGLGNGEMSALIPVIYKLWIADVIAVPRVVWTGNEIWELKRDAICSLFYEYCGKPVGT